MLSLRCLLMPLNASVSACYGSVASHKWRSLGDRATEVSTAKGVLRLGGLINFQVVFQCKRYAGTVSSGTIRDFRGAMIGRADKGLIISTGTFSRDARAEAVRDGAPAIDLVDGQELADLLKRYELGVQTLMVEKVEVNAAWFTTL